MRYIISWSYFCNTMEEVIIIGGGPAGLMAAQRLAERGMKVVLYEQKPAPARKFLVAGHGGFNLTHSMPYETMLEEYTPRTVLRYISDFTNHDTLSWLHSIGIETYTGSSGKIFPTRGIKPIGVVQAWLRRLEKLGVVIHYQHTLSDFDETTLQLQYKDEIIEQPYGKVIFAMGGASWPSTGATGAWISLLHSKGIEVTPVEPANSGLYTVMDGGVLAGSVLKNITLEAGGIARKGEVVFTDYGIEGSPVYYLNRILRTIGFPERVYIDLKPHLHEAEVLQLLQSAKGNMTDTLKKVLNINGTALQLLKRLPKDTFTDPVLLTRHIKKYPLEVTGFRPIEEVISTAGGVSWGALNEDLSLEKYPHIHCIGEMLDWDAPTGGFLLQACFAMGDYVGRNITG